MPITAKSDPPAHSNARRDGLKSLWADGKAVRRMRILSAKTGLQMSWLASQAIEAWLAEHEIEFEQRFKPED